MLADLTSGLLHVSLLLSGLFAYLQTCSQPELRNFIGLNLAIVYIRSGVGGSRSIEVCATEAEVHCINIIISCFLLLNWRKYSMKVVQVPYMYKLAGNSFQLLVVPLLIS